MLAQRQSGAPNQFTRPGRLAGAGGRGRRLEVGCQRCNYDVKQNKMKCHWRACKHADAQDNKPHFKVGQHFTLSARRLGARAGARAGGPAPGPPTTCVAAITISGRRHGDSPTRGPPAATSHQELEQMRSARARARARLAPRPSATNKQPNAPALDEEACCCCCCYFHYFFLFAHTNAPTSDTKLESYFGPDNTKPARLISLSPSTRLCRRTRARPNVQPNWRPRT